MRKAALHSRQNPAVSSPKPHPDSRPSNEPPPELQSGESTNPNVHYTVFIRLPFPRKDFKDPPPVEWDAAKDKALWKLISKASNTKELDWEAMSNEFDVSLPFLLQQAAWLYERRFEGMKAQMKRLGQGVGGGPDGSMPKQAEDAAHLSTGGGGGGSSGGVAMARTGSRGQRLGT